MGIPARERRAGAPSPLAGEGRGEGAPRARLPPIRGTYPPLLLALLGSLSIAATARHDPSPFLAADARRFEPVAVEVLRPLTAPAPAISAVPRETPAAAPTATYRSAVDPATFRALKEEAATDPSARPPDVEVPADGAGAGVLASFAGLDRAAAANHGEVTFPPDTILAKSGFRVLQGANKALRLSTPRGAALATRDLNAFFGAPAGDGLLYDPKVLFDRNARHPRLYAAALQVDRRARTSSIWLAVSRSPNPPDLEPASWCRYRLDGVWGAGGQESWADYPGLGAGPEALLLTTNQYRFGDDAFAFAVIRAVDKPALADNRAACPPAAAYTFQPAALPGDRDAFSLQPVLHYTSPRGAPAAYLVSTARPPSAVYRVWRVRGVAGGAPALEVVDRTGAPFGIPPEAPQLASGRPLQTGDARILQAAGLGDGLWAVHSTLCDAGDDGENESCVRLLRFAVGRGPAGRGARLAEQLTLGGGPGAFYWMPGLAVSSARQVALTFQHSSADSHLGAAWTIKDPGTRAVPPAHVLAAGTCGQTLSPRTGDYMGAQTNPNDLATFWLAGQRSVRAGSSCAWQTWIVQVSPGPA